MKHLTENIKNLKLEKEEAGKYNGWMGNIRNKTKQEKRNWSQIYFQNSKWKLTYVLNEVCQYATF